MGKIKDALDKICDLLGSIKRQNGIKLDMLLEIKTEQKKIADELVTLNNMLNDFGEMLEEQQTAGQDALVMLNNVLCDFGEMLEEQKMASQDAQLLRVMPAENAGKEALFVVTGDELANLLEACSGATLRMKKKEGEKK